MATINFSKYGYHADEDGMPDYSHPMTKAEAIETYWDASGDDPTLLADIYLDFHAFSRIEFLIFRNHLNSAILLSNLARKSLDALSANLHDSLKRIKPLEPWAPERKDIIEESLGITDDTHVLCSGAVIVTAAAALESLFIDLLPEQSEDPKGLISWMTVFFNHYEITRSRRNKIKGKVLRLSKKRNIFAHALTGSYFSQDKSIKENLTIESMDKAITDAGEVAVLMEGFLDTFEARKDTKV